MSNLPSRLSWPPALSRDADSAKYLVAIEANSCIHTYETSSAAALMQELAAKFQNTIKLVDCQLLTASRSLLSFTMHLVEQYGQSVHLDEIICAPAVPPPSPIPLPPSAAYARPFKSMIQTLPPAPAHICHSCNRRGHKATACTELSAANGSRRRCSDCGRWGHFTKECTAVEDIFGSRVIRGAKAHARKLTN